MGLRRFRLGPTSKGRGREGREGEGRRGEGRSTCLPPRFDNPGYGPVRGGKGRGRKGREGGKGGERDLALPEKKLWRRHAMLCPTFM